MVSNSKYSYKDFVVLYRTNSQSRTIEQVFVRENIPYHIYGSLKFFSRAEIKDIVSYLSVINNPNDNFRLKRIINVPKRGIGKTTIESIEQLSFNENISLFEAIKEVISSSTWSSSIKCKLKSFYDLIMNLRIDHENLFPSEIIKNVIEKTGYLKIFNTEDVQDKEKIENIGELISTATQYEIENSTPNIGDFLSQIALVSDVDNYDEKENDSATLMTIHSSKGLEFPVVFLTGLEEGIFPSYQSLQNEDDVEEERRLAYVAITRAKKILYLTYAKERLINGITMFNSVSRFINDIPSNIKETDNAGDDKKSSKDFTQFVHVPNVNNDNPLFKKAVKSSLSELTSFQPGDKVLHSTFGNGVIVSSKPVGADKIYEIDFEKVGLKKLMATYARLKKE